MAPPDDSRLIGGRPRAVRIALGVIASAVALGGLLVLGARLRRHYH